MAMEAAGVSSDPLRILVDLSFTPLGLSGIPQDSRLLLKVLSECPGVEPTGLVYSRSHNVLRSRLPATGTPDRILEKQAQYLRKLVIGNPKPANRVLGLWQELNHLLACVFRRNGTLRQMDSDVFWDVLWRRMLAPTLTEDDLPLARRLPVLLANLSTQMMNCRAYTGLPAPFLDTSTHDFALFHEARTLRISPNTCKIVRHHDLIPLVRPDLVGASYQIRTQTRTVRRSKDDSIFVCNSDLTRKDLVDVFPDLVERSVTIPCALADGYYPESLPGALAQIVAARECSQTYVAPARPIQWDNKPPPYMLMVSTIEPRKNHISLIRAFEQILSRHKTELRLMVVGNLGWMYGDIVTAMKPLIRQGRIVHLDNVPLPELRVLYSQAKATVFPSYYEGFGYSPLEGMCCDTPAIASDIVVHRGVYGPAALYCDPYSVDSIARAIERLCLSKDEGLRRELIAKGRKRVARYQLPSVTAQWRALLLELRRQGIAGNVQDARLLEFNQQLRAIEDEEERRAGTPGILPFTTSAERRQAA